VAEGARKLLNDYTKSNSALSRFFHGHWNRHYINEVSDFVRKIDNDLSIIPHGRSKIYRAKMGEYIEQLLAMKQNVIVNQKGSLASRIDFIAAQYRYMG